MLGLKFKRQENSFKFTLQSPEQFRINLDGKEVGDLASEVLIEMGRDQAVRFLKDMKDLANLILNPKEEEELEQFRF